MTRIALYHSVLGVRQGVVDAAEAFRDAGHDVLVVDQYDGRSFDDYEEATTFATELGFPFKLMESALAAVADEDGPIVTAGFSNGAGMAEYVAAARGGRAGGVVGSLHFSGALPLDLLGIAAWPADTSVQLHYTVGDPFRSDDLITPFVGAVRASGNNCEAFLDHPGNGHLFTDSSLPKEFDKDATATAFSRALAFLDRLGGGPD